MKRILVISLLSLSAAARADVSAFGVVQGRVGNFDDKFVELTLRNGTRFDFPRKRLKRGIDLRPGRVLTVKVDLRSLKGLRGPAGKKR